MDETQAVALGNDAFQKSVKPVVVDDESDDLYLFKCHAVISPRERPLDLDESIAVGQEPCGNLHFRHAGYLEGLMPFIRPDKAKHVDKSSYCVMVCTKCRACYIWLNDQMYDVTAIVDLEAWEKAERELHAATGPGGQC